MYLNEEEDVFWALSQLMAHPRYAMHGKNKHRDSHPPLSDVIILFSLPGTSVI